MDISQQHLYFLSKFSMAKHQVLEMSVARDDEYSLSWYCHPFKLYKLNIVLSVPWLCICCQRHFELETALLCICVARQSELWVFRGCVWHYQREGMQRTL